MTITRGFKSKQGETVMKKQLIAVAAFGLVAAGGGIRAQEKMPDKMSGDKMSHDKMGDKGKMNGKNGKSKKKTDKMGNTQDKMGGKQNTQNK
jgi:hypothetical protein